MPFLERFRVSSQSGDAAYTIGDDVMILRGNYAPEQGWLPFMRGCIVIGRTLPGKPKTDRARDQVRRHHRDYVELHRSREMIEPREVDRYLFGSFHPNEPRLPFQGARRLDRHDFLRLADVPGLVDRTESGNLPIVKYKRKRQGEFARWCEEMCRGYYCMDTSAKKMMFSDLTDAAVAKMTFYEGGSAEEDA